MSSMTLRDLLKTLHDVEKSCPNLLERPVLCEMRDAVETGAPIRPVHVDVVDVTARGVLLECEGEK